jgi:Peptidase family M50
MGANPADTLTAFIREYGTPISPAAVAPFWVYAIIGVGLGITVHELGHLAIASLFRLSPRIVSVGIGPPLLSFRIGELLIELRAFPNGGYVTCLPQHRRKQVVSLLMSFGGVLGNAGLFAALGAMSASHIAPDEALRPIAAVQVFMIVSSLFPWGNSDGMRILLTLLQREPDVLRVCHPLLLQGRATEEQIAAGPSPAFPEFLLHYHRLGIDKDRWVKQDAIERLRRALGRTDFLPVERALLLDCLISFDLFETEEILDLARLDAWSAEALALAPSPSAMMTRGCVLIVLGRVEEGRHILITVADAAVGPYERVLYCACRAEAEEAHGNVSGARHWAEQAQVAALDAPASDLSGVQRRLKSICCHKPETIRAN